MSWLPACAMRLRNSGVNVEISQRTFRGLPFGTLFCDYVEGQPEIRNFFSHNPFSPVSFALQAEQMAFNKDRSELVRVLDLLNDTSIPAVAENLNQLRTNHTSLTVVTGQQLTVGGGPLFTLYKIATTIIQARKLQDELNRPVIPVFWLADEDHDFQEIATLGFPSRGQWQKLVTEEGPDTGKPAGQISVDDRMSQFIQHVIELLPESDFSGRVSELLTEAYAKGKTHAQAFGLLIQRLFSAYGLVLAGSATREAKVFLSDDIVHLLHSADALYEALELQSSKLEKLYHRQANVGRSNWFLLDENGFRVKLQRHDDYWSFNDLSMSRDELEALAAEQPWRFSLNVSMRPVMQDLMLPNIAYVAGPGEIAYYAQMKAMYQALGMAMPVIVPRLSAVVVEKNIDRLLEELPFTMEDYLGRVEDLQQAYVKQNQSLDIQEFSDRWISEIESLAAGRVEAVAQFDSTLSASLDRVRQEQINTVHSLTKKMVKSEKNRLEVQLKRIQKVQNALFPQMNLQERELASIYLLNKYGFGIIDRIIESCTEIDTDKHIIFKV